MDELTDPDRPALPFQCSGCGTRTRSKWFPIGWITLNLTTNLEHEGLRCTNYSTCSKACFKLVTDRLSGSRDTPSPNASG